MKFLKAIVFFLIIVHMNPLKAEDMNTHLDNSKKSTTVLVHGFFRTKLNMYLIEKSLKKDNFEVLNWRYKSRNKYINEHGKDLVEQLLEIAKNNPDEPINFVTHSMGALVLRSALNEENCPKEAKIGKAILIAAPNKGSVVAQKLQKSRLVKILFKDKAGKELMENQSFDELGFFPSDMDVLQIVGTFGINPWIHEKNDGKVAVSETKLDTPYKQIDIKAAHSWICYSPKVIRHVKDFLK